MAEPSKEQIEADIAKLNVYKEEGFTMTPIHLTRHFEAAIRNLDREYTETGYFSHLGYGQAIVERLRDAEKVELITKEIKEGIHHQQQILEMRLKRDETFVKTDDGEDAMYGVPDYARGALAAYEYLLGKLEE